jgi:hypothetical protein
MSIIDNIKDALQIADKMHNMDLYKQLVALQTEILALTDENARLKQEVRSLNDRLVVKESLVFRKNSYWIEKAGTEAGPYCSVCWDVDGRLVRELEGATAGSFYCAFCYTRRR